METVESYNAWAVAYAVTEGVRVVEAKPGRWVCFILDNTDTRAQQALDQWRQGDALVNAREFTEAYQEIQRLIHASVA